MARILLLLGLLVLALFWAFGRRRDPSVRTRREEPGRPSAPRAGTPSMVRCAHCGLHLPEAEAVQDGEARWFCSEDHRVRGARA